MMRVVARKLGKYGVRREMKQGSARRGASQKPKGRPKWVHLFNNINLTGGCTWNNYEGMVG